MSAGASAAESSPRHGRGERGSVISRIHCLLHFFVLALLIPEATLATVLASSKLVAPDVGRALLWIIVVAMIAMFASAITIVTRLALRENGPLELLATADDLLEKYTFDRPHPELAPSALQDSIRTVLQKELKKIGIHTPPRPKSLKKEEPPPPKKEEP